MLHSLALIEPSFAHARLIFAEPADGAAVSPAPTKLRLKFSERVELGFTKVRLSRPQINSIQTGSIRVDPATTRCSSYGHCRMATTRSSGGPF
jgi:methionine-rich copper-binding protein CopC